MTGIYNKVGVAGGSDHGTGGEVRRGGVLGVLGAVLTFLSVLFILLTFPLTAWSCVQVVLEYERAVIFRLGRVVKGPAKGPGLIWFIPWLDDVQKVDLRTFSAYLCPHQVLTADSVPLLVDAVVFYRVVDPTLWFTRVQNGCVATLWLVQASLRAALGAHTLTDLLTQRSSIATRMEEVLHTSSWLWGVQVQRVEIRDLRVPISLQRCLAAEAEAERMGRAMMIVAEGELKASRTLRAAASELSPVALHLRYLQTLASVDSSASIVVWIVPTEILQ
ncbi:erythrocyte band 7 integral membrane protein-like [Poecilia reticulata]|uniref:Podocin n=1 Tax=Poecilia reticulata TaxID=8081 RepID=A0A3P9P558_POERE|nr:PREDICTED: erythrocyte band 7 integral membrane protein-like [Poecilia reticulata]